MKTCTQCKQSKNLTEYNKSKAFKCGHKPICRVCHKENNKNYHRSKKGVITVIYSNQKSNSAIRGHSNPQYTKQQLSEWLLNDFVFNLIFDNWSNCGFVERMKPSIDRLNDDLEYSFSNIRIITFAENCLKANYDTRLNVLKNSGLLNGGHTAVSQYTLDNILVKSFISMSEAERQTDTNHSQISVSCKSGKPAKGFLWRYKEGIYPLFTY